MPSPLTCHQAAQTDHAQLYELLVGELTDFVVFLLDPEGCVVSWNPGVERILGYTEAEWLGQSAVRIFTPEDRAQGIPQQEMRKAAQEGRAPDVRWHLRKNGERLYVEGTTVALRDANGQLLGFSKVMRDITERYRNEQRSAFLVCLDNALRPLTSPDDMMAVAVRLLCEHLEVDRCTYCEVEADEETFDILCDYTRPGVASLQGRYKLTQFGPAVAQSLRADQSCLVEDIESDQLVAEVRDLYRQAGVRAHVTVPLRKDGRLVAIMAVHQQWTRSWRPDEIELVQFVTERCWESLERSHVTRAFRQSEARYRNLFESIDEGHCIIEVLFDAQSKPYDYRFVEINPAFEQHTGFRNAVGRTVRELVPEHDQYWFDTYGQVAVTGRPTRLINQAQAMGRWFDVYAFRVGLPEAHHVAVLFRDITARQAAEAERERLLRQIDTERQRLQQIFAQAPVAVVVFRGRDFVVELANPSYQALLAGRELVGRRFADVVPELGRDVWDVFQRVLDTGEPFFASDWYTPYDYDQDGVPEDHWFNVAYNPLRGADGTVSGLIAVLTEVTAQVRARQELERINQELERVNRSLEEFAYVASHDLQEPLRMVNIYTQLILRSGNGEEEKRNQYAGFVKGGVQRMETLIRDLLTFSRTIHTEEEPAGTADLSVTLADSLSVLKTRIEESGATITAPSLPVVRGDTQQLSHVFQNLLGNSLKYRRPGCMPEITINAMREGRHWIISVRDNGIGFEPQHAQQIFGLFKRLHRDEYSGTGLGLAICQRIVERYGGRMWAESQPGVGSTFFFSLPGVED